MGPQTKTIELSAPPQQAEGRNSSRYALKEFIYRHPRHSELPHILSFSGGRSSAAMAMMAAEEGLLRPDRGDLLVFANTSAEHPGTYEFAAKCKSIIEKEFSLPFLWYEFCTVEDAHRGEYRRKDSYRLVNPMPIEEDPTGYRSKGEVFEEMLAYQGILPNPHSRTCTVKLKLFPAHKLLADWLGHTQGPSHAGHHWVDPKDSSPASLVCPERFVDRYVKNKGTATREYVRYRADYLGELPPRRDRQRFQDFTTVNLPETPEYSQPADMRGTNAAPHIRLIGLRADERNRVLRVLSRTMFAEGATTAKCTVKNQPPGEFPIFPLFDSGFDKDDILSYWSKMNFDLDVPEEAGNCVYCFMKGTKRLVEISKRDDPKRTPNTPTDINWWADVEKRHMRTVPARSGVGTTTFGFFNASSVTYGDLANNCPGSNRYEKGDPACDCTD